MSKKMKEEKYTTLIPTDWNFSVIVEVLCLYYGLSFEESCAATNQ